jgi:hypothetical protein
VKCYLQQSVSHQATPGMMIIDLLSFRHKSLLADLNAKHPFWNSVVSNPSAPKLFDLLHILVEEFEISVPQCPTHYSPAGNDDVLLLLCTRMPDCQKSFSQTFWTYITYQSFSTYWIILELGIFLTRLTNADWERFQNVASELISLRIQINSGEADKTARNFTAAIVLTYRQSRSKITL